MFVARALPPLWTLDLASSMFVARALHPLWTLLIILVILALPLVQSDHGPNPFPCTQFYNQFQGVVTSGVRDGRSFQGSSAVGGGILGYADAAGTLVTFTSGNELKLKFAEIWQAGVSSSASYTTIKSSAGSASLRCPDGPWTCALIIIPKIHFISGHVRKVSNSPACRPGDWIYFQLIAPDVDPNNVANIGVEICTCKDKAGWAAPGHIARLCSEEC